MIVKLARGNLIRIFASTLLCLVGFTAHAEDKPQPIPSISEKVFSADELKPDKSCYNLFHPTPKELMRELSTDRPDKTESPYSVDAGHFQIEWDLFAFTRDRRNPDNDGTQVDTYSFAATNFKIGLLNNVDVQFIFEPHTIEKTRARNEDNVIFRDTKQGFGDITTRVKINLWGNDGGKTAFAIMPFIKLPTNEEDLGNDNIEGGVILPLAVELPMGWGMGIMTEIDAVRNEEAKRYDAEFINTITFSHDIIGNLGGYVEFFSSVSSAKASLWVGTFDAGLTYGLTDNIQLDAGVNIGLTRSADDINPFLGLTVRF